MLEKPQKSIIAIPFWMTGKGVTQVTYTASVLMLSQRFSWAVSLRNTALGPLCPHYQTQWKMICSFEKSQKKYAQVSHGLMSLISKYFHHVENTDRARALSPLGCKEGVVLAKIFGKNRNRKFWNLTVFRVNHSQENNQLYSIVGFFFYNSYILFVSCL